MKPNIAFDIDGIVANFSSGFRKWVKGAYGLSCYETGSFHWRIEPAIPGVAIDRIIAEFIREHSDKIRPLLDGISVIDYVWDKTKGPILFVTARDYSTIRATHDWIRSWFEHIDFIVATVKSGKDKIKYLGDIDCFLEDRRRTCIELSCQGKTVFMPKREYNSLYLKKYQIIGLSIIQISDCTDLISGQWDHLIFKP